MSGEDVRCVLRERGALTVRNVCADCRRCGWNVEEAFRRASRIQAWAMKKRRGLRYLPIYRKNVEKQG